MLICISEDSNQTLCQVFSATSQRSSKVTTPLTRSDIGPNSVLRYRQLCAGHQLFWGQCDRLHHHKQSESFSFFKDQIENTEQRTCFLSQTLTFWHHYPDCTATQTSKAAAVFIKAHACVRFVASLLPWSCVVFCC